MSRTSNPSRRNFLRLSAAAGLLGSLGGLIPRLAFAATPSNAGANGIRAMKGEVFVNGQRATRGTQIKTNATVRTGARSTVTFVVNGDAHLLKSNTSVKLEGDSGFVNTLRLATGNLLSVWGKRPPERAAQLITNAATIGIRGTVTASSPKSFSLLSGIAELLAAHDAAMRRMLDARSRVIHIDLSTPTFPEYPTPPDFGFTRNDLQVIQTASGSEEMSGVTSSFGTTLPSSDSTSTNPNDVVTPTESTTGVTDSSSTYSGTIDPNTSLTGTPTSGGGTASP